MIDVKRDEEFYVILVGMEICFFTWDRVHWKVATQIDLTRFLPRFSDKTNLSRYCYSLASQKKRFERIRLNNMLFLSVLHISFLQNKQIENKLHHTVNPVWHCRHSDVNWSSSFSNWKALDVCFSPLTLYGLKTDIVYLMNMFLYQWLAFVNWTMYTMYDVYIIVTADHMNARFKIIRCCTENEVITPSAILFHFC